MTGQKRLTRLLACSDTDECLCVKRVLNVSDVPVNWSVHRSAGRAAWGRTTWQRATSRRRLLALKGWSDTTSRILLMKAWENNDDVQHIQIINKEKNTEAQTWALIIRWLSEGAVVETGNVYSRPNKTFYWFCPAARLRATRFYCTKSTKVLHKRQEGVCFPLWGNTKEIVFHKLRTYTELIDLFTHNVSNPNPKLLMCVYSH